MAPAELQWLDGGITAVPGILAGGVVAGIKPSGKKDLALIYSSTPARAAASRSGPALSRSRTVATVHHPARAVATAVASPIPDDVPVTRTVRCGLSAITALTSIGGRNA